MYQEIELIGNLGADPEMRFMQDGRAVTNFSAATNRRWTDAVSGEPVEETTWWRVSVFGPQAEVCNQYLSKGRQVFIKGRIKPDPKTGGPRIYTRDDGTIGATFEVIAQYVKFLGNPDDIPVAEGGAIQKTSGTQAATEEDEIPF